MSADAVRRAVAIHLTIPDNEARTALTTLRRHGIPLGALERAELWIFELDREHAPLIESLVRADETIFNANKHRLVPLARIEPAAGEVWIDDDRPAHPGRLPGIRSARRYTAWTLRGADGRPASREVVDAALGTLLLNPAYQTVVIGT